MARLAVIRAALGEHLERISGLVVEPNLAAITTLSDQGGAVIGAPGGVQYFTTMGRGYHTWELPIYLLMPATDYGAATAVLDDLVDTHGDRSVIELLWTYGRAAGGGLGVVDAEGEVDLDIRGAELTAYGIEFASAGQAHIGAVITCEAHTSGRPA